MTTPEGAGGVIFVEAYQWYAAAVDKDAKPGSPMASPRPAKVSLWSNFTPIDPLYPGMTPPTAKVFAPFLLDAFKDFLNFYTHAQKL